jgi:GAF domain-containing protein
MGARVAWVLTGVTFLFVIADVVVTAAYLPLLSEDSVAIHGFPFTSASVLGSALLGAVILTRYERHAVGLLMNLIGFTGAFSLLGESYNVWVISESGPGPSAVAGVAGWLALILGGQLAVGGLAVMFLVAPAGHFLSPRWRWVAVLIGLGALMCGAAVAGADPTTFDVRHSDPDSIRAPVYLAGFALIAIGLFLSLWSLLRRWRSSTGIERLQVRLIALGAAFVILGVVVEVVVESLNGGRQTMAASLPLFVSYFLLPVLFAVAVLRYRLYDIEVIINRTVVLAFGTAFAGLGYTTVVVVIGRLVDDRAEGLWLSLLATAVVALAFQPLRRGVIGLANRIAYGARAQPYVALSDFSRRLAETPSPETLLPAVAEAAGRAVAARRATATLHAARGGLASSATWGAPPEEEDTTSHVVPVSSSGVTLGTIRIEVLRGRPLRASDLRLLAALGNQAAVAFRNAALETQLADHVDDLDLTTRQLAQSRSRIIEADDAVRRALEAAISRDVLPRLTALPGDLRQARAAVAAGTPANGLDLLVASTNTALEDLRELTRGVFPTQLGRFGIEPALRSFLARTDPAPSLSVDSSASGRRFPARVETAVYFCCVEAARSVPAMIELGIEEGELVLRIGGLPGSAVDLQQVIDRAEAVGGSVSVDTRALVLRVPVDHPSASAVDATAGGGNPGL